ncbi:MAG: aminotransferase class V-fold PLP-dependent enzyme [Alphaproteobacteria bacterium]|nr:aminotransferase class V-fold PLP-dependent enzyme [Alphaproteobacteria bacterium]
MSKTPYRAGRHFLQIPGPTPVPGRIERAMLRPVMDHRSQQFAEFSKGVLDGLKGIFKTTNPVIMFPSSGTGAWEAALANTLSPGDKIVMFETGQFSLLWQSMARKLGLDVDYIESDWRVGVDAAAIGERLAADKAHQIKAVAIVHNDTATGCCSPVDEVRKAIDAAGHPALLMVDTVSSLACVDYQHDGWGVDVTVCGSQKGLMLPPGLSFTAVSDKALEAMKTAKLPRAFFSWHDMLEPNSKGFYPYTPGTTLMYGLEEAMKILNEEGLDNVFARHAKLASGVRAAVKAWGLENQCRDAKFFSNTVTSIRMPEGHSADALRKLVLENFNMSLGAGLTKVADKVFRIGHLGDTNELTILGALGGVEMGLGLAGVPHSKGGVQAAMDEFTRWAKVETAAAA